MEVLTPLAEVLEHVKTRLTGYDLERTVRSVVRNLCRVPTVEAIFIHHEHRPQTVRFIVVMQTQRTSWNDELATSDRMDQHIKPLMRRHRPLQIHFSWSSWEKWRRQDGFAGTIRVWLRPRRVRAAA